MKNSITLAVFNASNSIYWNFGTVVNLENSTQSLLKNRQKILDAQGDYVLFWNAENELPKQDLLEKVISSKGNCWHIGSAIGLKSYPKLLDAVQPTHMQHVVIDENINHSSWKASFQAMLIKKVVFEHTGIESYSNSIDVLGLDYGYNAMKNGALIRYNVDLASAVKNAIIPKISKNEELFFIKKNFDKKAYIWAYLMNVLSVSPLQFLKGFSFKSKPKQERIHYNVSVDLSNKDKSTSIVIATLERYGVLANMLKELRELSLKPLEIIIVDQTEKSRRSQEFLNEFTDLPIVYIETDKIGQCSSRNLGIQKAKGSFIWFLDDDMAEIPSNYLEKHFQTIYALNTDVSCGIPDEVGTTHINREKQSIYVSDGFPAGDALVKRSYLQKIGGFDEKMDQLKSEDQELGLRLVKEGALSVKNNQLRTLHLRASRGGLRNHNVRKVTFSSSRNSITERNIMHFSEIYFLNKHFSKAQVQQLLLLCIRGTFIIRGNLLKKISKLLLSFIMLPNTLYKLWKNSKKAQKLSQL